MEKEKEDLIKEQEKLYNELTAGFTQDQFRLLNELIDTEIELERFCNL